MTTRTPEGWPDPRTIRPAFVCSTCSRVVYPQMEDFPDWLVGYRWRGKSWRPTEPTESPLVTRCPQHITVWAARTAGVPHTADLVQRIEDGRMRDLTRLESNPALGQNLPFMLPEVADRARQIRA